MERHSIIFFYLSYHLLLHLSTIHGQPLPIVDDHANDMQTYVVDVERHEHHDILTDEDLESWHASFLPNLTLDSGEQRLLYSYRHVLSGFSARLTLTELEEMKYRPGSCTLGETEIIISKQPTRQGKIVLCEPACEVTNVERGEGAFKAGAEGMIILSHPSKGHTTYVDAHILPASYASYPAGAQIRAYYFKNKPNVTASINFNGTQFGFTPSPTVPAFSSRGPSQTNGGLIKPDVLAPGSNILAALPKSVGPNPNPLATHTFNFQSGTSMSAPHVSGIAALIRSKHRGWTPSEILSAIVTTAASEPIIIDEISNDVAGIYATGAGVVDPVKALDPGLVFGQTIDDYFRYLCGLGYDDFEVYQIMGLRKSCSGVAKMKAMNLNYPSIGLKLTPLETSKKVVRTAKNVVDGTEEYTAKITQPPGVDMFMSTYKLKFTRLNQEESYEIRFDVNTAAGNASGDVIRRGKIVWESAKHSVTMPIAVTVL